MGLPLEQTTPLSEVVEASTQRMIEALETLGPLAEKLASTVSLRNNPTIAADATIEAAALWVNWVEQAALGAQRAAGNAALLRRGEISVVEWESQTPVVIKTPEPGTHFRVVSLVSSEGRPIADREVTFCDAGGDQIDRDHPTTAEFDGNLRIRVRTWGWAPTGPIGGRVATMKGGTLSPPFPVYFTLG